MGRTVADMRVDVAGVPLLDPAVLDLIETRVGEPLTMLRVRSTIDHLVGLGRFEDVRVFATPSDQAVVIRWQLTPVRRIGLVSVTGHAVFSERAIRTELSERYGFQPSATRVPDVVSALQSYYAERGYRNATILPRIDDDGPVPERVELVLSIDAGARTTIADATVTGTPLEPVAELLRKLAAQPGRPFDGPALDARVAAYEEELRGLGYYEARVRQNAVFAADGRTVTIALEVETGPHVRVVFEGDPLPQSEREALAPIRQERSVDQDLLEDASASIESALRQQGYRAAQAPYTRRQEGAELVLTFTITRGPLHRVGAADVAGMSSLRREDIAPLLQINTGDAFVEARVGAVAAAIAELYRVRGFLQAAVKPVVQVLPAESRNNVSFRPVDITFTIAEGPQTIVNGVEVEGTTAMTADQLKALLVLTTGRPLYRPQLAADRDAIEREYRNLGYQSVSVTSQLAFEKQQQFVEILWTILEGEQITVDRILINGHARVSVDLIRREVTLRPGSPMSDDAIVESQRRLASTGLFRRVRITELPRTGASTRDVLIEIEEAEATTVTVGGGFEVGRRLRLGDAGEQADERIDVAPRGFFDISRRNLWGKNRSVTLFTRVTLRRSDRGVDESDQAATGYGLNDYRAFFSFREPRAFGTSGDGQVIAFIEQAQRSSFDFNRKGVSVDYARRIHTFTVTGRYTFDYTKLFGERIQQEDQLLIDRLFPQVKLSKFFGSVLRDSRDDVLDPQRGAVVGIDASVAAKVIGSEVGFTKTFMQGFLYRRLPGRGVVIAAGARLGIAVGFPQQVRAVEEIAVAQHGELIRRVAAATAFPTVIRQLPASERFFAGGDTTVRGFALDRLGTIETLDPQGFPQGGNGLAVFNLEARAPYWKNIQLVWFGDAGNVFKDASDIRLDELRLTSGLGFRYRSPIGPLRVDWGWKISTRLLLSGGRERSNVLHISLGQAF
ncbi:MAG: POTRA domain-containing protein [Acidobacteriota bacterium]|nr:POTRA domain-containing protein [Acidobacteriota bacterium]